MSSFNNPKVTNPIKFDIPEIRELLQVLAKQDYTGVTDTPTGAKRIANVTGGMQLQNFASDTWSSIGKLMHDVDRLDGYHASTTATKGTIPVYNASAQLPGSITGNAATATKLASKKTIDIGGIATADAVGFDGSGNITIPINSINVANDDDDALVGIVSKAHGGTGRNDGAAADVIVPSLAGNVKASAYGQIGYSKYTTADLNTLIVPGHYVSNKASVDLHYPYNSTELQSIHVYHQGSMIRQILRGNSDEWVRTSSNSGASWTGFQPIGVTKTGTLTIYISKSGSDTNTGLDSSNPVLTFNRALSIAKAYIPSGSSAYVRFYVGAGDWGSISLESLPYSLYITSYSGDNATEYSDSLPYFSLISSLGSTIRLGSIVCDYIDATLNGTIYISTYYIKLATMRSRHGGVIEIDGNASNSYPIEIKSKDNHDHVYNTYNCGSIIHLGSRTVNVIENLTLTGLFLSCNTCSTISMNGAKITEKSGVTVTGKKYQIQKGCIVTGVSVDSLPGTVAGIKQNGAVIDGIPYGGGASDEALMADLSWKPVLLQTGGTLTGSVIYRSSTLDDSKVPSNIISYNPIAIADKNGWYAAGICAYNETNGNKTLQFSRVENNGSDSCFINLSINNGVKSIYTNVQTLTLGGNPPDSANGTEAITAAWANKNIGNKLVKYLPLAGGTMTGTYPTIKKGDANSGIIVQGGTNLNDGASLYLYGNRREGGGWFQIISRDANGKGASFVGRPGGSLTWNGKHIVRSINNVNADTNGNVNITGIKVSNATYADSVTVAGYQPTYNNIAQTETGPYNINIRVPTWGSAWFVIGNYAVTGRYSSGKSGSIAGIYAAGAYILNENIYASGTWPGLQWTTRALVCIRLG